MATMDGSNRVDWSKLPVELWPLIGKNLKTRIEVLRFRSVCSSLHSSIPSFQPSIPLKFPFPFSTGPDSFLSQITVYLLKLYPGPDPNPSTSSAAAAASSSPLSPSSSSGWLLKLEDGKKIRVLSPISSRRIRYFNDEFPKALNLLDFNMVELAKTYALKYTLGSGSIAGINKVVIPPNFKDCCILVIYEQGKLGFARNGDEKLTLIDDRISDYNDLIVYKGQSYVVDRRGTVFWVHSSLKVVQFSPPLVGLGQRKHLVESRGVLYVVDRYLNQEPSTQDDRVGVFHLFRGIRRRQRYFDSCLAKAVDFKVYKLDEEGGRWDEVKSLGDQAFFLNVDCSFSISARELVGCKGNCIYFTDQNDVGLALRDLCRQDGYVFNLEDHSIERLELGNSQIFWPPQLGSSPNP